MGSLAADMVLVVDTLEDLAQFRSFEESPLPELKELTVSGSAQFTEEGLKALKEKYQKLSLMIVDLRRESHGFVDTLPISWMLWDNNWSNMGWSIEQIGEDEEKKLAVLRHEKTIVLTRVTRVAGKKERSPMPVTVTSAYTESNLCAREGLGYMRIPVTDHQAPEEAQINQVITLYKTKPPSSWIHFHCKAGRGRTTVFLTFWDMLTNAKKDSFDTIIKRQEALSSYNLVEPLSESAKRYLPQFEHRLAVLKQFYAYCKNNSDNYATPFKGSLAPQKHE